MAEFTDPNLEEMCWSVDSSTLPGNNFADEGMATSTKIKCVLIGASSSLLAGLIDLYFRGQVQPGRTVAIWLISYGIGTIVSKKGSMSMYNAARENLPAPSAAIASAGLVYYWTM